LNNDFYETAMIERVFCQKNKLEGFSLFCDYFKSKHVYFNIKIRMGEIVSWRVGVRFHEMTLYHTTTTLSHNFCFFNWIMIECFIFFDPNVTRLCDTHCFNNFKQNGNWRQRQRKVCVVCTHFELEKHFKKTHCVASFSLVSSPQVSSSSSFTQAQRHLYRKAFSSPKGYPSIKVSVVGRSGSG